MKKVVFIVLVLVMMLAIALPVFATPGWVTICHQAGKSGLEITIDVSKEALTAHLPHGDYYGECES